MSAPYPWPVKPFNRQHPVRGFFNDPRVQGASHAFHFGIDVSAPDGTAVYAVTPGKVFIEDHGHAVAVLAPDGRAFGYWHVKPAVAHHQQVAAAPAARAHRGAAGATSTSPRASRAAISTHPAGRDPAVHRRRPSDDRADHVPARQEGAQAGPHQGPRADLLRRLRHDADPRPEAVVAHARRAGAAALPHHVRGPLRAAAARRRRSARVPEARRLPHRLRARTRARTTRTSPAATRFILDHDWNTAAFANDGYLLEVQAADRHGNRATSGLRVQDPQLTVRARGAGRSRPARDGTRPSG